MANYIYKARDDKGKLVTGHLKAKDKKDARISLRKVGYYPIEVASEGGTFFHDILQRFQYIGLDDMVLFCQQFSSMINSGVPILVCLDVIWKQTENKKFQIIISKIKNDLEEGSTLFDAMRKQPRAFPQIFLNLIRVGETSGMLGETLQKLVEYFIKEYELRQKVKSAFIYPIIVMLVATGVIMFMITAVIPIFAGVFARLSATASLPLPTLMLLFLAKILKQAWWILPLVLFGCIITYDRMYNTKNGKYFLDGLKLKLPLFGKLIHKIAIARFIRSLGITIGAGIPINHALLVTADIAGNEIIKKAVLEARSRIIAGSNLHRPLVESGLFPDVVLQMVATGEEAGTLEDMLQAAASQMDQEIDYKVKKLTIILEPLLTLILGIVVAFIALSLYLPIFDLIKIIR